VKLKLFWITWVIDVLIGALVVVFFFISLADGSVSSFNAGIWIVVLAVLAIIIGGGYQLKRLGHATLAAMLLLILAVPGLLYGLFLSLIVVTDTSWN